MHMRIKFLLPLVLLAAACDRGATVMAPVAAPPAADYMRGPGAARFITAGSGVQVPAPSGLVACWNGEGNANDLVLGHNGTMLGDVSFVPGRFGQAFSFNALGGDVIVQPNTDMDVMKGDGITLSAWFLPKGAAFGVVAGSGPVLEYDNGAQIWVHSRVYDDPMSVFFADMAESDLQHGWHIVETGGVITQNVWNHGVATYSRTSGNITTYVNGVQVGQEYVGVIGPVTNTPFHIGSRQPGSFGSTRYTFNGLIDDAQVYNRALTPAEVLQMAAAPTSSCNPPTQLGLVTQPAGAPLTSQPVVDVRDASGLRVSFARAPVTVSIASGTGTLSGTTTVQAVNGVATFTNLQVTGATVGTTLRFASTGLTSVTSNSLVTGPSYSWQGFFGDLNAAPSLNRVKAGKEIDIEFSLGGDKGPMIFATGFPATRVISCTTLANLGPLVPLGRRANDDGDHWWNDSHHRHDGDDDHWKNDNDDFGLKYSKHDRHYTLEWQTEKSFDGSCRAMVLTFADGSSRTAYFSFSKKD